MINRPLQSRSFNSAVDDDFWASGIMLMTGVVACAAYILVCVLSLAHPDSGDDLRASVTLGPVQLVATGAAVDSALPAALRNMATPLTSVAYTGVTAGCPKSVRSTPR